MIAAPLPLLAMDEGWEGAVTVIHQNLKGENIIDLTQQLCDISAGHPAYRVAGSAGAEEAADMIAQTFQDYGLEVSEESFEMPVWDLSASPYLFYDDDGDPNTDMVAVASFNAEGFSLPIEGIKELATLPLPSTLNRVSIGNEPIDEEAWSNVNTTDKALLIGREVRWDTDWEQTFKDKLAEQPPSVIIFHYSYSWMSYAEQYSQLSTGGSPLGSAGPFFWDLDIAVGCVNYSDGQTLKASAMNGRTANISIPSSCGSGLHRNIVADIPSSDGSDKIVLLGAHYDTVMCEGYIDNTASVATLLETARVIQEAKTSGEIELRYNLRFVAFAGEEMGLVGSIHYVKDHLDELGPRGCDGRRLHRLAIPRGHTLIPLEIPTSTRSSSRLPRPWMFHSPSLRWTVRTTPRSSILRRYRRTSRATGESTSAFNQPRASRTLFSSIPIP